MCNFASTKTRIKNMKQRFDKLIQDLSYNLYEKELEVRLVVCKV